MNSIIRFSVAVCATFALAGCATWSTGSIKPADGAAAASVAKAKTTKRDKLDPAKVAAIAVTENDITDRPYDVLGDLKVTVNRTTIFNKDPTHEQVDDRLREEAAKLDADAVVLVRYGTVGIGVMSWGSLDGQGRAVKFK